MNDEWADRLSAYMDDELDAAERVALEAHLAVCGDCRRVIEQLREVVATAKALRDREPATDLWSGIATAIRDAHVPDVVAFNAAPSRVRRISFSVPQLAAAAVALMLLSGSAVWMVSREASGGAAAPIAATGGDARPDIRFASAQAGYDAAIVELQEAVAATRERLSPETVQVLERNLAIIDAAIDEARDALARDPASLYLNRHLDETMMAKIDILRRAADLGGAPI